MRVENRSKSRPRAEKRSLSQSILNQREKPQVSFLLEGPFDTHLVLRGKSTLGNRSIVCRG